MGGSGPEIVEIFSAGVSFGLEMGRRGRSDPHIPPTNGGERCGEPWSGLPRWKRSWKWQKKPCSTRTSRRYLAVCVCAVPEKRSPRQPTKCAILCSADRPQRNML